MIFSKFVIDVLINIYIKVERDPSGTIQVIADYISDALGVALSEFEPEVNEFLITQKSLTKYQWTKLYYSFRSLFLWLTRPDLVRNPEDISFFLSILQHPMARIT